MPPPTPPRYNLTLLAPAPLSQAFLAPLLPSSSNLVDQFQYDGGEGLPLLHINSL